MNIRPILISVLLTSIVGPAFTSTPTASNDKVWIIVRPTQCMSNAWEKEWLAKHNNDVSKYPRTQEFGVIQNYFRRKGISILEVRQKPYIKGDPICLTCDCIRGDTLFLLVKSDSVLRMVNLGYTERIPAKEVPDVQPKAKSKKK
jgi:hypothetical protein